MQKAKLDFAILGREERCNGDSQGELAMSILHKNKLTITSKLLQNIK